MSLLQWLAILVILCVFYVKVKKIMAQKDEQKRMEAKPQQ